MTSDAYLYTLIFGVPAFAATLFMCACRLSGRYSREEEVDAAVFCALEGAILVLPSEAKERAHG